MPVIVRLIVVTTLSALGVFLFAPASMAADFRAHWLLDEVNSPTAADATGNDNTGTNYDIVGDGSGYTFNGTDSRVIVPNAAILNPGAADFSWGVTISMTAPPQPVGESYDVLRKGLSTTAGGDYKFEVKNVNGKAEPHCVSKTYRTNGTKVNASILSGFNLADGKQHTVTCTKTSTGISLKVDGLAVRTKTYTGGLGSVSNTSNLALGAKAESTATTGFDWFAGELYDAWVS